MSSNYVAKPVPARLYQAEYLNGVGWRVVGPDGVLPEEYPSKNAACAAAGTKNAVTARAAGRVQRSCMCCQKTFLSEGKHNRLCDHCRRSGAESRPMTYVNPRKRYG